MMIPPLGQGLTCTFLESRSMTVENLFYVKSTNNPTNPIPKKMLVYLCTTSSSGSTASNAWHTAVECSKDDTAKALQHHYTALQINTVK